MLGTAFPGEPGVGTIRGCSKMLQANAAHCRALEIVCAWLQAELGPMPEGVNPPACCAGADVDPSTCGTTYLANRSAARLCRSWCNAVLCMCRISGDGRSSAVAATCILCECATVCTGGTRVVRALRAVHGTSGLLQCAWANIAISSAMPGSRGCQVFRRYRSGIRAAVACGTAQHMEEVLSSFGLLMPGVLPKSATTPTSQVFGEPLVTHATSKCDMYYCRCTVKCRHLCGDMSHSEHPLDLLTRPWPPVTSAYHRIASAVI